MKDNVKAGQKKKANKEKIMEAALQIFAEKGYQETTISEISKKANVADTTIYEYFDGKEDMLFSVSEKITQQSIDFTNQILPFMRDPVSKIRTYLQIATMTLENNPFYAAVCVLELKTNRKFHLSKSYQTFKESAGMILDFIKEGIEAGVFRKDIDPYLMRATFIGAIEHVCARQQLLGIPLDLKRCVDPLVALLLEGASVREKTQITCPLEPARRLEHLDKAIKTDGRRTGEKG